jgi:hypothetical protein
MEGLRRQNGVRVQVFCESLAGYLVLWVEGTQIVGGSQVHEPSLIFGPLILDAPRGSWLANPEVEVDG